MRRLPGISDLALAAAAVALALFILFVLPRTVLAVGAPLADLPAKPAPSLTLADLADRPVSVGAIEGRIVLIHFWATWCGPCVVELPSLEALWRDRRAAGLEVIAIATDNRNAVTAFTEKSGLGLPVALDPYGKAMRAYRVRGLPTTVVVGRDGQLRALAVGQVDWNDAGVQARIDRLIAAQ